MFSHDKLDWSISRIEKRLQSAPDDVATRLEYALACLSKAEFHEGGEVWYNRALTQARRVLQADPSSPGALVVAGVSLVGLERLEPAARYLDEALRLEPERAEVHLGLGLMHERQGDRHRALRELEITCRLAPDSWEPHYLLGRLLAERAASFGTSERLLERSQYHIVRALQLGPSTALTPALLHILGASCLRSRRYQDAHKLFLRLQEYERYRAKARYSLGLVSFHLGKYKNAILYLRQHLEEVGDSPRVQARIGMAYLHLGEVAKAREACNRALALEPTDLQSRWTLGCALLEEGHVDEAVRAFRDILRDAPEHTPAFTELVRLRTDGGDVGWLQQALRKEVSIYDRLPLRMRRDRQGPEVDPRAATRRRIDIVLKALAASNDGSTRSIVDAMDLTTDEGLRFALWEAALDRLASTRAELAARRLKDPGRGYSASAGRDVLTLASVLPEALLIRGLQIDEEDLRRAAVDRHGPAHDVTVHRENIDHERQEARAWQALLLLAIATRGTRSGRNLLLRWASDADPELAHASRTALAVLGDPDATDRVRERASGPEASAMVDALVAQVLPPEAHYHPRPVSDDEESHCSTCGRRVTEVEHMMAGSDAVLCDRCMMHVARHRRELSTDRPEATCGLCGKTNLESRAVYAHRGVAVCATCVDGSIGLLEREEVDRFLSTW